MSKWCPIPRELSGNFEDQWVHVKPSKLQSWNKNNQENWELSQTSLRQINREHSVPVCGSGGTWDMPQVASGWRPFFVSWIEVSTLPFSTDTAAAATNHCPFQGSLTRTGAAWDLEFRPRIMTWSQNRQYVGRAHSEFGQKSNFSDTKREETGRNPDCFMNFHDFCCARGFVAPQIWALPSEDHGDCERARGVPTSAAPFRFPKKELERYKIWYVLIYGTPKRYKIYEAFEEHRGF